MCCRPITCWLPKGNFSKLKYNSAAILLSGSRTPLAVIQVDSQLEEIVLIFGSGEIFVVCIWAAFGESDGDVDGFLDGIIVTLLE